MNSENTQVESDAVVGETSRRLSRSKTMVVVDLLGGVVVGVGFLWLLGFASPLSKWGRGDDQDLLWIPLVLCSLLVAIWILLANFRPWVGIVSAAVSIIILAVTYRQYFGSALGERLADWFFDPHGQLSTQPMAWALVVGIAVVAILGFFRARMVAKK